MRFSKRRRTASSMSQGQLLVARTTTCAAPLVTPSIYTVLYLSGNAFLARRGNQRTCCNTSDLNLRLASCSSTVPRLEIKASASSKKTMDGAAFRAAEKTARTSFSLSPLYLDVSAELGQLKKRIESVLASAFARSVFPVPAGPKSRTPFQGSRIPVKKSGASTRGG